jgi:class 3 adenylate cyclase
MSDIRAWLESLDLGDYAALFEAEQIDRDALPHLTAEVLKELGVPTGPRLKMLAAIKAPAAPTALPREAERRQITVMFCDLVGSTALSEKLDPEDLRTLMQSYQQAAGGVIERYGGHVAQYLGDGLMTYFGWPQAHEDDAERAVRASLDIVEAVGAMDLAVRIGIATGPVVVGETGAGDASVPKLAVGETPNLAARLQGLAGPDEIVVGASTRRLLGGTFELVDLGEQALKGIVEPVPAHRISGVATTEGRFEAQHQHLTPLVGREAEMAMVMARWEQACAGEGQVILLSGEPGIGKSRITQTLRERVAEEPHTRLRYQCSPYHTNSTLHPVIEQLERAAGFQREDTPEQKLDKLESLIPGALVASLLSLPVERYPALAMSPQKQKEETLKTLADQVTALAADQPVLLIFEDAHWIDPTSQELLDIVVPMLAGHRVLAVITYRPEYAPPWLGQGQVTPLALTRLGRADAAAMVARVSDTLLPDDVLDQIVAKTDGVPLFVEELTKTVVESGAETADTIPETLQDSLMARLDRLAPVKEVAQIGACIGREFSHELLAAVSDLGDNELSDAVGQLVTSELIHRAGNGYVFKHALVQDTAYDSLLKSKRRQLHLRIATALEERDDVLPEVLGHHCAAAGLVDRAIPYFVAAGHAAMRSTALHEAVSHLNEGLSLVGGIGDETERDRLELDVRAALGTTYMALLGWPAAEVEDTLESALALCRKTGGSEHSFSVLFGLYLHHAVHCRFDESIALFEEMITVARDIGDTGMEVTGLMAACVVNIWMGDFASAAEYRDRVLERYDFDAHCHLVDSTNHDPKTTVLGWDTQMQWILGYPDRAKASERDMVALTGRLEHPFDLTFVRTTGAAFYAMRREPEELRKRTNEAIEISIEHGFPLIEKIIAPLWGAPAHTEAGEPERCVAEVEPALEVWISSGAKMMVPYYMAGLADALRCCGRSEDARAAIDEAQERAESTGQGTYLAEIYRIKGETVAGAGGDPEPWFRKAIEDAKSRAAKGWELRAATSLARLWQGQGKAAQAHELLSPVHGWFTEGFDTPDLIDAKALLEELA